MLKEVARDYIHLMYAAGGSMYVAGVHLGANGDARRQRAYYRRHG